MPVATDKPFSIIYSLYQHQFLGYLFAAYAVQEDGNGKLTLNNQTVSPRNAKEFESRLYDSDYRLIELCDQLQQENVVKKYSQRKTTAPEFFLKVYDTTKGDKNLQELIVDYVDRRVAEIFKLLPGKQIFEMGSDGQPIARPLKFCAEQAQVKFHFKRLPLETHYYPSITVEGKKLDFQFKNAMVLCINPAMLLVGDTLYHFASGIDGNKLKPFLNKAHITVARAMEERYYDKFVGPLIEQYQVEAEGFEIREASHLPGAELLLKEYRMSPAPIIPGLAAHTVDSPEDEEDMVPRVSAELRFRYGPFDFRAGEPTQSKVVLEHKNDQYIFYKVQRNPVWEKEVLTGIASSGLHLNNGKNLLDRAQALDWMLGFNESPLAEKVILRQELNTGANFFLGKSTINVNISEGTDWFDIKGEVQFGPFKIPFSTIRQLMLQKKREFVLPNGEIAIIPEEWYTRYSHLMAAAQEKDGLKLDKMHLALLDELKSNNLAEVTMSNRLQRLRDFQQIEDYPLPNGFSGTLRPYQKAGYNWMRFLAEYKFGGCLADDMGLGKTVQTLALLQHQKEQHPGKGNLLVLPTSLIYNWQMEAKRFAPNLKVLVHAGPSRQKDATLFAFYDLIITSYGTLRSDIEWFSKYVFRYIILDESQAIKNPGSIISRAVQQLSSDHRLVLTGTPLENTSLDLWSQMHFINPGLLGSQNFFRSEYLIPIEKKSDDQKLRRLQNLVKPFMLRRNKKQVAADLPEKNEYIQYCEMSPAQEVEYEKTRSHFRNVIMDHIEKKGINKSQIFMLQGLTILRQMANHPAMVNEDYLEDSGKMETMMYKLEEVVGEGHKVLVFSQFVKHLGLVRQKLEDKGISFAYLDGSTRDRQSQVELFQQNKEIQVFLISLKAGGVGLNLTAADYVFLLDPWWNPAVEAQAVDRAHRIGQTRTVFIYKFITRNSVEEKILSLQRNKLKLVEDLVSSEESFIKSLDKDDIMELLA